MRLPWSLTAFIMPKKLKIITDGNPTLREIAQEIDLETVDKKELAELIEDMNHTMKKSDGVGLAAPQIDKSIQLVLVNSGDGIIPMINPEITKKSWAKECGEEGCLSVPKTFGVVARHKKIRVIYFDLNGNKYKIDAKGMFARIIQHEIDHLNGVLFTDSAEDIKYEK